MSWHHRMKVHFYAVNASRNQQARWWYWAQKAGFRALGRWLERLADREVRRLETEGGYRPPDPPR